MIIPTILLIILLFAGIIVATLYLAYLTALLIKEILEGITDEIS